MPQGIDELEQYISSDDRKRSLPRRFAKDQQEK